MFSRIEKNVLVHCLIPWTSIFFSSPKHDFFQCPTWRYCRIYGLGVPISSAITGMCGAKTGVRPRRRSSPCMYNNVRRPLRELHVPYLLGLRARKNYFLLLLLCCFSLGLFLKIQILHCSSSGPPQFPQHIPVGLPSHLSSCFPEILHYSTTVRCDGTALEGR